MCDEGRHTVNELHRDRLLTPTVNGASLTWPQIATKTGELLRKAIETHGAESIAVVLSPQASCEDLFTARRFADALLGPVRFYVGGKGVGEGDDFLIQPDKNPNRNGLELMFGADERPASFGALVEDIESGKVQALYMMGSEIAADDQGHASFVDSIGRLELVVLQSAHGGELADVAKIVLPACTHAEKEGTYVNCDGVVQTVQAAFAPHGNSLPDWKIFVKVAERMGAPLAETALREIRHEMLALMEANSRPASSPSENADEQQAAST
jgi:NADH-quinone oxidoreductase subunit G